MSVGTQTPNTREEQDAAYNPGDLHAAEQFSGNTSHGIDQAEAFANDPKNASARGIDDHHEQGENPDPFATPAPDPMANMQGVKKAEETPWDNNTTPGGSNAKQPFTAKSLLKKKGPIGLLVALLGLGGFGALTGPSLSILLPNISARSFYGNVDRAGPMNWRQSVRYAIGNQEACEGKPTGIRCKLATSSDDIIERYKKEGFTLETKPIKGADGQETGRHVITAVTFPDGKRVTDGSAFLAHMDANVGMASRVLGVFNPRSAPYVGRNFALKVMKWFGLKKDKITISGKDKEEIAHNFDKAAGQPAEAEESVKEDTAKTEESVKAKSAKVTGKITNIAGMVCGAYDVTRGGLTIIKFANAARYVAFGWLFFKLADQIRAGDADPETIAAAAAVLTTPEISGENKGKTALDSPGFKAMMYGDRNKLSETAQSVLLSGNPALISLDTSLIKIKEALGGRNVHTGCKLANDPIIGIGVTAALCGAGGAAGGTVVPVLGNVVGGVGGVAVCTAGNVIAGTISGMIMGRVVDAVMKPAATFFAKSRPGFNMPKVGAGNAIAIAGALLMGGTGLANGMKLGTKDEVLAFNKVAYESDRQYEEIARYDARETPFDITNQYSFIAQLASKLGVASYSYGSNPFTSMLSSVGSIFTNTPTLLLPNSFAAEMTSPIKEGTLGECKDPELRERRVSCDAMDMPQVVMSKEEMSRPTEPVIKFMEDNQYITEEGGANPDKDYTKYLLYCTGQQPTVLGGSDLSIDDDDYDWPDRICQLSYEKEPNNEQAKMVSYFRTYTFRVAQKDDEDTQYTAQAANAGGSSGTGTSTGQTGGTATPGSDIFGDDYKSQCGQYAYCTRQCVDFVLFRLVKHKVLPGKRKLGNGKDVVGTLKSLGYKVDSTPAVHAVLSTGRTSQPQYGHTAMVSQVNSDGSIVVEEYNYNKPLAYSTRTISAEKIKADGMTFAHTEVDYK